MCVAITARLNTAQKCYLIFLFFFFMPKKGNSYFNFRQQFGCQIHQDRTGSDLNTKASGDNENEGSVLCFVFCNVRSQAPPRVANCSCEKGPSPVAGKSHCVTAAGRTAALRVSVAPAQHIHSPGRCRLYLALGSYIGSGRRRCFCFSSGPGSSDREPGR